MTCYARLSRELVVVDAGIGHRVHRLWISSSDMATGGFRQAVLIHDDPHGEARRNQGYRIRRMEAFEAGSLCVRVKKSNSTSNFASLIVYLWSNFVCIQCLNCDAEPSSSPETRLPALHFYSLT